jgi:hypothetical protein
MTVEEVVMDESEGAKDGDNGAGAGTNALRIGLSATIPSNPAFTAPITVGLALTPAGAVLKSPRAY